MPARKAILAASLTALVLSPKLFAQTNNEIFERMLGPAAKMDPGITVTFLKSKPGMKVRLDTDADGKIDTIYFIDNDDRHSAARQPLLVKVVDEDGDMPLTGEGDLDSDLYVADWNGDGSIDRAVDYLDADHDQDVDEVVQYRWHEDLRFDDDTWELLVYNGRSYSAFWACDVGDDNRLLSERDYEYNQEETQWKCDFNGDEIDVYAFLYDAENNRFVPGWENPFCWYDLDGDQLAEEVVRLTGKRNTASNLRYSMDIDNDSQGSNRHDYDLSITALGPIRYAEEDCRSIFIRGIPTGSVIAWEKARTIAKNAPWVKAHLTFDENDNNIDPVDGRNHNERWEGVLNHPNEFFPQVGGPSCGPFNKRNEVDSDNSGRFQFYRSGVDRRWHLFGAEAGWIKVDYDYDGKQDMEIRFEDRDLNGFFDFWRYDLDGDGAYDREWRLEDDRSDLVQFDYAALHQAYSRELGKIVAENQKLIEVLKRTLEKLEPNFMVDEVEDYFSNRLVKDYDLGFKLGEKIKSSLEGIRYYGDLIRDRYFFRLLKAGKGKVACLDEVMKTYLTGEYGQAAALLENRFLKDAVRSLARVKFSGLKGEHGEYRVRMDMSAFTGNRFSQQDVTIWGADGADIVYSPGLQKLPGDEWYVLSRSGVLACWGNGYEGAGEIGLAVMFNPEECAGYAEGELDRYIKLKSRSGEKRRHWIYGDWRKGFPNSVAPTGRDWALEVEDLVLLIRTPVSLRIAEE
jgi:hypothetical protein